MKSNKFILKIASIAVLTTSLISFNLGDVQANSYYTNQYGTAYRTGNTVTRSYGTPNTTSNISRETPSQTNDNTTKYTNTTPRRTYGSYTSTGGTVTRYYGPNSNNTSSNNDSNSSTESSNGHNSPTIVTTVTNNNTTNNNETSYDSTSYISKMLNLINSERSKNGLKNLTLDNDLTLVAQLKADDMVKSNYFSHVSPNHGSIDNMIKNAEIKYYVAGENIAKAYSIESAHNNFMNSWSHRRAILAKPYTHVGIGITKNSSGMYVISVMFVQKN